MREYKIMQASGTNIIVRQLVSEKKTESGLYTDMSKEKDKVYKGYVISVGPRVFEEISLDLHEGDLIAFDSYSCVLLESTEDGTNNIHIVPARSVYMIVNEDVVGERTDTAPTMEVSTSPDSRRAMPTGEKRKLLKD
jgi:co-chaperonin GroES (HSP10)